KKTVSSPIRKTRNESLSAYKGLHNRAICHILRKYYLIHKVLHGQLWHTQGDTILNLKSEPPSRYRLVRPNLKKRSYNHYLTRALATVKERFRAPHLCISALIVALTAVEIFSNTGLLFANDSFDFDKK